MLSFIGGSTFCFYLYQIYSNTSHVIIHHHKEYVDNGNTFPDNKVRSSKYTSEQRKAAVDYYVTHGKSITGTIRALGYPGKSALCEWLNKDLADSDRKWFCKKNSSVVRCSQEQKDQAIIAYCSGEKTPKQISEEFGISPYTIYPLVEFKYISCYHSSLLSCIPCTPLYIQIHLMLSFIILFFC